MRWHCQRRASRLLPACHRCARCFRNSAHARRRRGRRDSPFPNRSFRAHSLVRSSSECRFGECSARFESLRLLVSPECLRLFVGSGPDCLERLQRLRPVRPPRPVRPQLPAPLGHHGHCVPVAPFYSRTKLPHRKRCVCAVRIYRAFSCGHFPAPAKAPRPLHEKTPFGDASRANGVRLCVVSLSSSPRISCATLMRPDFFRRRLHDRIVV